MVSDEYFSLFLLYLYPWQARSTVHQDVRSGNSQLAHLNPRGGIA